MSDTITQQKLADALGYSQGRVSEATGSEDLLLHAKKTGRSAPERSYRLHDIIPMAQPCGVVSCFRRTVLRIYTGVFRSVTPGP
jgi:hypothetical protein